MRRVLQQFVWEFRSSVPREETNGVTKAFIHMWRASRKIKLLYDQGKITPIFWFPHRQERSESRLNQKATAMSSKGLLIVFPNAYSRSVLLFLIITLKFLISYRAESAVSVSSHLNQEMPNSFYFLTGEITTRVLSFEFVINWYSNDCEYMKIILVNCR